MENCQAIIKYESGKNDIKGTVIPERKGTYRIMEHNGNKEVVN